MNDNSDLIENPAPRCACMLVLDVSSSMQKEGRISQLNEGVMQFLTETKANEYACDSVELGVVTFGGKAKKVLDFSSLDEVLVVDEFKAEGMTPMGEAVNIAIDMLEARKREYKKHAVSYYQPWLVIMTDGGPNDDGWEQAAARLRQLGDGKKLTVFGVGVGNSCDITTLSKFCPTNRPALKLKGLKFAEFFQWLSQSVITMSQSHPGVGKVKLPTPDGIFEVDA